MTQFSDLGVLGLAVMGANLARNAARKGFGVALYNRHGERTDNLVREFGQEGRFTPTKDLKAFVAGLIKPRVIVLMVQAGKAVDDVIDELLPHIEADDIVIDGGNSLFTDTDRRFASLKEKIANFELEKSANELENEIQALRTEKAVLEEKAASYEAEAGYALPPVGTEGI